ncbi:hypothetical protein Syun_016736 [Stephania yunnanensis]|uniref:Uncharacterized protein n=1 Tax=Stephania yunnanensis TaxID=152371 RepID=A0AAP0J5S7_9MAGN
MTKARPRKSRKCPEDVAINQAVEAVMEPDGSKGARQLGNCLDQKEVVFYLVSGSMYTEGCPSRLSSELEATPESKRALARALAQARVDLGEAWADLGTGLGTGTGGPWHGALGRHGRTLARYRQIPWRRGEPMQVPWARVRSRLGPSNAEPRQVPWARLNIYYRERCVLSQGRHGQRSKDDPRACLGHHAKARPLDPWSATLSRWGSTEPRLAPEPPGRSRAPPSNPCPLEKHGQRPLRRGWAKSRRFQAVEEPPWSWAGVMIKARPRKSRKCPEHVAIDQAVEALMEPGGAEGARQLGTCLDHKGSGVLLGLWIDVHRTGVLVGYVTTCWLIYKAGAVGLGKHKNESAEKGDMGTDEMGFAKKGGMDMDADSNDPD